MEKEDGTSRELQFNDIADGQCRVENFQCGDRLVYELDGPQIEAILAYQRIQPMSFLERIAFGLDESSGGRLDNVFIILPTINVQFEDVEASRSTNEADELGAFIWFSGKEEDYIYNPFDAGNFIWGAAQRKMGFESPDFILFAADANEGFNDSETDQAAIKRGFLQHFDPEYNWGTQAASGATILMIYAPVFRKGLDRLTKSDIRRYDSTPLDPNNRTPIIFEE